MAELTENYLATVEELLTPSHSIPPNIHSLNISGSKGRFSSDEDFLQTPALPSNHMGLSYCNYDPKQYRFDQLYMDAAKRSVAREKLNSYTNSKKEKEVEVFKSDKKLSKADSLDLFERLNKEAESRNERYKMSKKLKEVQEVKELKQPKINKIAVDLKQDVITRLMQYGENAKRKNEEKIKQKQEREEEEIKNTPSVHRKTLTESSLSNISTPIKSLSGRTSPLKKYTPSNGTPNTSVHDISPFRYKYTANNSSNSPEKIIQKIQNLAKLTKRVTPTTPIASINSKLGPVKITNDA